MSRSMSAGLIGLLTLGGVLLLSLLVINAGLLSEDGVTLWAGAVTADSGQMPIGRVLAAYPTIPFLATVLLQFSTPAGTPTPSLLAAGLVALLSAFWFASIRRAGIPWIAAGLCTLLLAFHPAVLRAGLAGPSEMFFAFFFYLFCNALFDLRARSAAPEVMAVALALLGLTFSHPMGAALACAAVPFLALTVEPPLVASSPLNILSVLVFPTVFCLAAFSYISWVFPGSGWTFLVAPSEGLATWSAGAAQLFSGRTTGSPALDASIAVALSFVLGAPLIPVALAWVHRRRPLILPAIVIVAITIGATWLAVTTAVFGDPSAISVAPPILAAVIIARVNVVRERFRLALPLLLAGWLGGLIGVAIVDPRSAENVRAAIEGSGADPDRIAAIDFGRSTAAQNGILVDTLNAPGVVLGRGRATGLLTPSNEAFALDVLFSRIDTPFIAIPDPKIGIGAQDRLNKAFPLLYRFGAPGYHLVYNNASWRLYGRDGT